MNATDKPAWYERLAWATESTPYTEELELPRTLSPAMAEALGLPAFVTGPIAHLFRADGHQIPPKCEAEQAFVLFWLLRLAIIHGDNWRREAGRELGEVRDRTDAKRACPPPEEKTS